MTFLNEASDLSYRLGLGWPEDSNIYQEARRLQNNYQEAEMPPSSEASPLMGSMENYEARKCGRKSIFHDSLKQWIPSEIDSINEESRSWRRRLFLLITEPETSFLSACFYVLLIIAIVASILLMILQTMDAWQYTPTDCWSCGG